MLRSTVAKNVLPLVKCRRLPSVHRNEQTTAMGVLFHVDPSVLGPGALQPVLGLCHLRPFDISADIRNPEPRLASHECLSLVSISNVASTLGRVAFGHPCNRFNSIYILVFIATFVSGVASFFVWGLCAVFVPTACFVRLWAGSV
ncbi:MFS monocarboxylate transporter-like protein [Histoplasma ohiense]|nr:MFS monocarboxylate transporter-like protein [Histoplasma ohiense (nom. inval.)]